MAKMVVYSISQHVASELPADQPVLTCALCYAECTLTAMHWIQDCECVFCKTCLNKYLSLLINEGNCSLLTCPDAECGSQGRFNHKEIEKLVDKETYDRYIKSKFEYEVELDPHRTFCPGPDCETVCHVCPAEPKTAKAVNCPSCGLHFCSMCKSQWHGKLSCDDNQTKLGLTNGLALSSRGDDSALIKRCPLCHVPIERDEGCAQMMCRRCKHVFCWYCLASLDDDFLLRHYDKGPCKNKLGHSRASVILHRAQSLNHEKKTETVFSPPCTFCVCVWVVGIFAGFGVLLLVASPFLLLAAPCILCCKCKVCKCCDDDEGAAGSDRRTPTVNPSAGSF